MEHVSRETLTTATFFNLEQVWFSTLFDGVEQPWELLAPGVKEAWIRQQMQSSIPHIKLRDQVTKRRQVIVCAGGEAVVEAGVALVGEEIEFKAGVHVESGAWLTGPTILGPHTVVRQGAYVRGGVITGANCVIGHATEVKSSIFLNSAKAAHFAYVGDSILGSKVNLGAGTKVSNLKLKGDEVFAWLGQEKIRTGLRKFGAIVGDGVETGCNAVLNPGCLLAPKVLVYPCAAVANAYFAPGSRIKA